MMDPLKMLRQAQQMQSRAAHVEKELDSVTVEASAGGSAVTVVATGAGRIVSVHIDPAAAGDAEMLQDLVVAAVNEALQRGKKLAQDRMAAELGLPPGLI